MSEQGGELSFETVVRSPERGDDSPEAWVLIERGDDLVWIIDGNEQSPFHAFADCRVVVSGEIYKPGGSHLIGWGREGGITKKVKYFKVSSMRLAEPARAAELAEVGPPIEISGRFESAARHSGDPTLCFITEKDGSFLVANDPAGAKIGRDVKVFAYPVQLAPQVPKPWGEYLWIICPCSGFDIDDWRARSKARREAKK